MIGFMNGWATQENLSKFVLLHQLNRADSVWRTIRESNLQESEKSYL